ncbi:unnamed protein product [Rotaria sp. Silwood1]|nr:unnamed protein product [Rotaria sp. Silwood1]
MVVDLAFDKLSKDAGVILVIGILFAMISSSRLFVAIDKTLAIIYRLHERSFLRQYLMAIALLLAFIMIFILMLVASSVPSALMNTVKGDAARFGLFIAGILISLSISFGLFQMIYRLTPNKKMSLKKTWCGALIAAIILELFIILFPLYVRKFISNYAGNTFLFQILFKKFVYCFLLFFLSSFFRGQIGFAVILIIFFYYFAIILIFGAQINSYFFENNSPLKDTLGTYISQIYQEHHDENITNSSFNENNNQQDLSTNNEHNQINNVRWINKLWPFKRRYSIEPLSQSNNST